MNIELVTTNAQMTMDIGQELADLAKDGSVFLLSGDLGAGKTTLVRGVAKGLNIKSTVQSPTFNILKIYFEGVRPLIHIDAYRLDQGNIDIGLDEYIGYENGITMIEWPQYIASLIPAHAIEIVITNLGDDHRKIAIKTDDERISTGLKQW